MPPTAAGALRTLLRDAVASAGLRLGVAAALTAAAYGAELLTILATAGQCGLLAPAVPSSTSHPTILHALSILSATFPQGLTVVCILLVLQMSTAQLGQLQCEIVAGRTAALQQLRIFDELLESNERRAAAGTPHPPQLIMAVGSLLRIDSQALETAQGAIGLAVYFVVSLFVLGPIALVCTALGPVLLWSWSRARQSQRSQRRIKATLTQAASAAADEVVRVRRTVLAANTHAAHKTRLARMLGEALSRAEGAEAALGLQSLVPKLSIGVTIAAYAGVATQVGGLTPGLTLVSLVLALRATQLFERLALRLQRLLPRLARLDPVVAHPVLIDLRDPSSTSEPDLPLRHAMQLRSVALTHPAPGASLQDLNADIPAGEITAFVADIQDSGLADLILGLQRPSSGQVLVDGTPIHGAAQRRWRDQVAYVPAEVVVLNDTLAANLRLSCPYANDKALLNAMAAAQLLSLMERSSRGLNTPIGRRGPALSAGERQRLGFARALLRSPRLLLLEDIGHTLSPEDQVANARLLNGLRGRCTVVIVAQRASAARIADRVVVIEDGRVAETGTFAALSAHPLSRLSSKLHSERP